MYRTEKGNFLILPPWKQVGETTSRPWRAYFFLHAWHFFRPTTRKKRFLTDFTRILKNLGEKNSFSENLTKLKKTCQKNSFWEKFAELSPTVRCTGISENQFWQYGGAYSDRQHTNKSRWKSLCRYRYPFGQTRTAERAWIRYRNRAVWGV